MYASVGRGALAIAIAAGCSAPADEQGSTDPDATTMQSGTSAASPTSAASSDAGMRTTEGTTGPTTGAPDSTAGDATTGREPAIPWEEGSFQALPLIEADLVEHVLSLEHPTDGGYVPLGPERTASLEVLLDAMDDALVTTLADPEAADWCGVLALAEDAGYELHRFYDTATSRWLLRAADATPEGHAWIFINPQAKRDLVVEVPHHPFDSDTAQEGARILMDLSARALILAKEHRCSDPDASQCSGNTQVCDGFYRESDVAHDPRNAFHVVHAWYVAGGESRFAQLHGFAAPEGDIAEIGDGTNNDVDPRSIANVFAEHLGGLVGDPTAVFSCQSMRGDPPTGQCGGSNVQAHATHAPRAEACASTGDGTGRFLHIEQSGTLRDEDDSDGASWTDVRDALVATWPECTLGDGPLDCALGPAQAFRRAPRRACETADLRRRVRKAVRNGGASAEFVPCIDDSSCSCTAGASGWCETPSLDPDAPFEELVRPANVTNDAVEVVIGA